MSGKLVWCLVFLGVVGMVLSMNVKRSAEDMDEDADFDADIDKREVEPWKELVKRGSCSNKNGFCHDHNDCCGRLRCKGKKRKTGKCY